MQEGVPKRSDEHFRDSGAQYASPVYEEVSLKHDTMSQKSSMTWCWFMMRPNISFVALEMYLSGLG